MYITALLYVLQRMSINVRVDPRAYSQEESIVVSSDDDEESEVTQAPAPMNKGHETSTKKTKPKTIKAAPKTFDIDVDNVFNTPVDAEYVKAHNKPEIKKGIDTLKASQKDVYRVFMETTIKSQIELFQSQQKDALSSEENKIVESILNDTNKMFKLKLLKLRIEHSDVDKMYHTSLEANDTMLTNLGNDITDDNRRENELQINELISTMSSNVETYAKINDVYYNKLNELFVEMQNEMDEQYSVATNELRAFLENGDQNSAKTIAIPKRIEVREQRKDIHNIFDIQMERNYQTDKNIYKVLKNIHENIIEDLMKQWKDVKRRESTRRIMTVNVFAKYKKEIEARMKSEEDAFDNVKRRFFYRLQKDVNENVYKSDETFIHEFLDTMNDLDANGVKDIRKYFNFLTS